ncbi:MAG: ABC transporter substrate-binding protein [Bacillota bacterium]
MKRSFYIAVVFILLTTLLVSCSWINDDYSLGKNEVKTGNNKSQSESVNNKPPVTFTMFCVEANDQYDNFESPVAKMIREKTGASLKIDFETRDIEQKVSLMLASGEYPDFIFAKEHQTRFIEAGAFIKLDELIETYGPNIKKLYGKYFERLRYSLKDPSIYYLGSYGVGGEKWSPMNGFELQHRVVKELGYPKIRTLKDFENAISEYKKRHPFTDGQPTIGLSLIAEGWRFRISVTNPAVFATGGPDDGEWYVDPKTQKVIYHYTRPEEKEYFRWLNHMNHIGLLDPETFVQTYDQYIAKVASGRVLALIDADWNYKEAERALMEKGSFERMYGIYPVTLSEKYKNAEFQNNGYSGGWGIGITKSCKDPVRAIQFFDWLCSEEGQILVNWGVEGLHYSVENGIRVTKGEHLTLRSEPGFEKKTGIGVYSHPFPIYGTGIKDSTGQFYKHGSKEAFLPKTGIEREVLSAYGAKYWADLYPTSGEFPEKVWGDLWQLNIPAGSEAKQIMDECDKIVLRSIPEAVLVKPEDFDVVWNRFIGEIEEAGIHKAEEELSRILQDRIKLWNQ